MSTHWRHGLLVAVSLCCALTLEQCGSNHHDDSGSTTFALSGVSYGRGIQQGGELEVVSPLSLVDVDPTTGKVVPDSLRALGEGVDLRALVTIALTPDYRPVVIPRNGVLVLEFSEDLDPDSVRADELDDAGAVIETGSVQLRRGDGRGVRVELIVRGNRILLDPTAQGHVALPPSPVVLDELGRPVPDPTGFLTLVLPLGKAHALRSVSGRKLAERRDHLGAPEAPIGLNPGNALLDFIEQNDLFPSDLTFNGCLPDVQSPRLVRDHIVPGSVDFAKGDRSSSRSLLDMAQNFDTRANQGRGEWAGKLLLLRPGSADEEQHVVASNSAQEIFLVDQFGMQPRDGDAYALKRTELFEPQPGDPIDPGHFDPDNPENEHNRDLRYFVFFDEIDATGTVSDRNGDGRTRYSAFEPVPSRSIVRLRFSEPIDLGSVLPWESFQVEDDPRPGGPGREHVGVVQSSEGGTGLSYVAKRECQSGSCQAEFQGFLPSEGDARSGSLDLTLRTVPDLAYLREHMSRDRYLAFLVQGYRGITDLGGRPLAFSDADFHGKIGFIDYGLVFTAVTTQGEVYHDIGAIVHLFRGTPITGNDPDSGEPGAHFRDRPEFYGPYLADLDLAANGRLAGAPVKYLQRILDDQNPPPDGPFFRYPYGAGTPLAVQTGARFQHVYRALDCSPNTGDLAGSLLDLYRASWAPYDGEVTDDTYENISVHAAHSEVVPDSHTSGGVPDDSFSGLGAALDPETSFDTCQHLPTQKDTNYVAPLVTTVPVGTRYVVTNANLYRPPGDGNPYHPWPAFTTSFAYNNRDSLLLEYRFRPQETPISFANGFAFSPAILSSYLPNFRMYSVGTAEDPLDPDDSTDLRQRCGMTGDNSRYFAVFDYVKTTSVIQSAFIGVVDTSAPDYSEPIFDPPLADLPAGTRIKIEFQGADGPAGLVTSEWTEHIDDLDLAWLFIRFRLTLTSNEATLTCPSVDSLVIPYRR